MNAQPPGRVAASGPWARFFRTWYRALRLVEPVLLQLARRPGFGNLVVLRVEGRRSGSTRELPLGLLTVGTDRYIGHPSGDCPWTLNLRAAGWGTIERSGLAPSRVLATVLEPGPERDAVVRATFRQHPFPGNAFYRLAGSHVAETGVFFRLEEVRR